MEVSIFKEINDIRLEEKEHHPNTTLHSGCLQYEKGLVGEGGENLGQSRYTTLQLYS